MSLSLRESLHEVSAPRNLDAAVEEVFQMMLRVKCRREAAPPSGNAEAVTAVVGFGGLLSGACLLRAGADGARRMAACMTGMEFAEIDDTVKDAVGEICNMLAGSWKSKVPELAANCGLSVPAVITGRDYSLRVQAPEFELWGVYGFGEHRFEVKIVCDNLR